MWGYPKRIASRYAQGFSLIRFDYFSAMFAYLAEPLSAAISANLVDFARYGMC